MSESNILYILTALFGTGGILFTIWKFYSNVIYANQQAAMESRRAEAERTRTHEMEMAKRAADEQEAQRQHERELAKIKTQADLSEDVNIWQQMVGLQTKLMGQGEQFSDFIIQLATDRSNTTDKNARDDLKLIVENWAATTHELKEVREALAQLIEQTKWDRADLKTMSTSLLEFIAKQDLFYAQAQTFLGNQGATVSDARDILENAQSKLGKEK